jgi:hypothetical protein
MKPVLIVENSTNSLIRESSDTGKKDYILQGTFTEFGVKNRNERIYTADKFLPALKEMNERMTNPGAVYGEFDHPDVFDTSLSRASHLITKANYVAESNLVSGEIRLLSTYWGKEAKALVDDGCPVFVSSRAAGITESDGTVSLKKLFTYDIVADPGFASAKMSIKVLNESLGYNDPQSNFRIYDLSNESKTNDLFNMNKNEYVTKQQLTDYSKYLVNELASTKKEVKSAISKGNLSPKKLEQLLEYYDELNSTNSQVVKYLDYLAEKVQIMVNENKSLKETTDKLIKHNDYLAENLEKAVNYSEYLAENLDKNIAYSEYVAENLDKNIAYSEYIAENLDKNITYSEYLAENLDKNISYSEYLAENLDKNIAYSEYIAENLDKTVSYAGVIAEKMNSGSINESKKSSKSVPTLEEFGFDMDPMGEEEDDEFGFGTMGEEDDDDEFSDEVPEEMHPHMMGLMDEFPSEEKKDEFPSDEEEPISRKFEKNSDTELSKQIDKLILEATKRKVSETNELHFLRFLNKRQVDSYYNLSQDEQEQVKLYINEKSYFTGTDVLRMIQEALSAQNESLEERLIRLMPENIKPIWSQLNESAKRSVISQARLYPDLTTEANIEHFWMTRSLKKKEPTSKTLVTSEPLLQEDKLAENDVKSILERFKNL